MPWVQKFKFTIPYHMVENLLAPSFYQKLESFPATSQPRMENNLQHLRVQLDLKPNQRVGRRDMDLDPLFYFYKNCHGPDHQLVISNCYGQYQHG